MSLINRVKDILLKPKETWPVIEGEAATTASLYKNYLVILAAIPAVCGFIGMSLIGVSGFGISFKVSILSGLSFMVAHYLISLASIFILSMVIDALAPTFGGQKNPINALKLAVYASTAGMVGGVFSLLPALSILGLLAGLYSIYLVYLGLPVLMKNSQEKTVVYTIIVLLVGIVISIVLGVVGSIFQHTGGTNRWGSDSDAAISLKTPGGEININTAKMEAAGKKMEDAQKQMEAAQKSGDPAAIAKATGDAVAAATGALGGNANVASIPGDALKLFLLPQMNAFKRISFEVQSGAAVGLSTTTASADYQAGNQTMHLTITDMGGMSGWVSMTGAMVSGERETGNRVEKTWQENGRTIQQQFNKDGSHAELKTILKNGVIVELSGNQMSIDTLRSLSSMIDMNGLENFQRPKKS